MTRSFKHWNLQYLWNRLRDKIRIKLHPQDPWLTPDAVKLLDDVLSKDMRGLEFGSGNSTTWFAQRLSRLTSVEHAPAWYANVTRKLADTGLNNVDYLLREQAGEYVAVADIFVDNSLNFALVDGIERGKCVLASLLKIKPGGMLVIDDVHRYLPSKSRAPLARKPDDDPADEDWAQFMAETMNWEFVWTTNGIKDTVIYYKPVE